MKKIIVFILPILAVIAGCEYFNKNKDTDTHFIIKGSNWNKFEGELVEIVVRDTIEGGITIKANTTIKNGEFTCAGNIQYPQNAFIGLFKEGNSTEQYTDIFILEPGELELAYHPDLSRMVISGGKYNEMVINEVFNDPEYRSKEKAFTACETEMNEKDSHDRFKIQEYIKLKKACLDITREKFTNIRYNHPDPYARLLAITHSGLKINQETESELSELEVKVGSVPELLVLRKSFGKSDSNKKNKQGLEVGDVVNNFSAKDPNGTEFQLADVLKKNKYVLVEFWASWCSPCRLEIPHMKKAYEKYKDKGFEILSFTFDHDKRKWEKASQEESIPWINLGDSQGKTNSVGEAFGVTAIPKNYLVNQNGAIIAVDLRQKKLDQKLEELLGE